MTGSLILWYIGILKWPNIKINISPICQFNPMYKNHQMCYFSKLTLCADRLPLTEVRGGSSPPEFHFNHYLTRARSEPTSDLGKTVLGNCCCCWLLLAAAAGCWVLGLSAIVSTYVLPWVQQTVCHTYNSH